jgi:outer membrane protein assembly factor BamB
MIRFPLRALFLAALALCLAAPLAAQATGASGPEVPGLEAASQGQAAAIHFRWAAGGVLIAKPVAGDGIVYFLSQDRAAYALDEEGRVLYRAELNLSPKAVFTPGQAGFLFIADGRRIIRLNRSGGISLSIDQAADGASALFSPIEGRDGRVFVAGDSLACFSATGKKKWQIGLSATTALPPLLLEDGSVALALVDGSIMGVDPFGQQRFSFPAGGRPRALIAGSGSFTVLLDDSRLLAFGADGKPRQIAGGILQIVACPDSGDCAWYALTASGELAALDSAGKRLWTVKLGPAYTRIKAFPGRVYALGKDIVLSCTRTGTVLKVMTLRNASVEPEVSASGIVYSSGADWIVYAYRFDEERLAAYGPAPAADGSASYGLNEYDRKAILGLAALQDSNFQENLLDDVEKSIKSGNMGEGERYCLALCSALARSKLDADSGRAQAKEGMYPQIRARACLLLGQLGSTESRDLLIQIIRRDPEPAVKAAAAEALGLIAWDGDGESMEALRAACQAAPYSGWEEFLLAASGAIQRISLYEGVPVSNTGIETLMRMADEPFAPKVRRRAQDALYAIHAAAAAD